jgi:hypothetical protein
MDFAVIAIVIVSLVLSLLVIYATWAAGIAQHYDVRSTRTVYMFPASIIDVDIDTHFYLFVYASTYMWWFWWYYGPFYEKLFNSNSFLVFLDMII